MATLLEMRTRALQRSDNEYATSGFVDTEELNGLINTAYKELYGLLVRYSIHQTELISTATANGSASYTLPDDYYSIVAVFRVDGTIRQPLLRHDWRFKLDPGVTGPAISYRVMNSAIEFDPVPTEGTYEIRYIPLPAELSLDADSLDGVLGWEEYIVCAVARDIYDKEGFLDAAARQDNRRRELAERIKLEATEREATQSLRVQDVRNRPTDFLEGAYRSHGVRSWRGRGTRWW